MKPKTKKIPYAIGAPFFIKDPLTPPALTGDVDDYNPTGLAETSVLMLDSGSTDVTIGGLATGEEGRVVTIMNIGTTNTISLGNQTSTSSATNRFIGPNGQAIVISYGGACTLMYHGDASRVRSSRWRAIGACLT